MSISYGAASRKNIEELDGRLQRVLYRYADWTPPELDLSIICGHRGEAEQTKAFQTKKSKTPWPKSKHNRKPSWAFDFRPFPFPSAEHWKDAIRFGRIAGGILLVASIERVPVRWGVEWDQDGQSIDEGFLDLGHVELIL